MEHGFGIKGTVHKWFNSYITGRQFRGSGRGKLSDKFGLNCGQVGFHKGQSLALVFSLSIFNMFFV